METASDYIFYNLKLDIEINRNSISILLVISIKYLLLKWLVIYHATFSIPLHWNKRLTL